MSTDLPIPARSAITVLVVDDEHIVLQVARGLLQRAGFKVLIADTGPAALRQLREQEVSAVLLDLSMPGHHTPAILRAMRLAKPHVPIVMCTGQDIRFASDVFNGPERGPDGFLQKPFSGEELSTAIERALSRRRGSGSGREKTPTR
jgi:DNA-binding response OmpR family regulator